MNGKYGKIYDSGIWEIRKLTNKPKKWILERNEKHPLWKSFELWFKNKFEYIPKYKYQTSDGLETDIINGIENEYINYQYITLNQWKKFFQPNNVDLSIINDTDWFYIKTKYSEWLAKGNIIKKNIDNAIHYSIKQNLLHENVNFLTSSIDIIELRLATNDEIKNLYDLYPKLKPIENKPIKGELYIFKNTLDAKGYIAEYALTNPHNQYVDANGASWNYCFPLSNELKINLKKEINDTIKNKNYI